MAKTTHGYSSRTLGLVATVALVLVFGAGAVHAGSCTTALIEEPFVLPDGTEQEAGRLTLCVERKFSPVQSLHEVKINDMPMGMALSRHSTTSVSDARQPALIFTRGTNGQLCLLGYTTPAREGMRVYTLQHPRAGRNLTQVASSSNAPTTGSPVVLIAALTH